MTRTTLAARRVRRFLPEQLEAHLVAGSAQALDVRAPATIAGTGYVPGALHLPDGGIPDLERFIVVYGVDDEDSRRAAEHLSSLAEVGWLDGGFAAWQDAELPIAGLADWHTSSIATVPLAHARTA